jgi:hypothetical protein
MIKFIGVDWHPDMERFHDTKRIVDNSNAWSAYGGRYTTPRSENGPSTERISRD